jgi:predicted ABC-type ATPase
MPAPTIYVIGGCNGAGKTTFAREFLPSIGVIRFLNADEIARGLSPLRPEVVAFKGSARFQRAGFGILPKRT